MLSHSQTRSRPLSLATLLSFGPVQAVYLFPQIGLLNVAPLCLSCLSLDGMNPPQAEQTNPSSKLHSCAPWSS